MPEIRTLPETDGKKHFDSINSNSTKMALFKSGNPALHKETFEGFAKISENEK
jgi:hypothetical protein